MALIMNVKSEVYDVWTELYNNFLPINYLTMKQNFDFVVDGVDVDSVTNSLFWLLILFGVGYLLFCKLFQHFLRSSRIIFFKRKQFVRAMWNIAFTSAALTFLFFYHKYMISPELVDNSGKLFPMYENTIFYKSQPCERFQMYSVIVIAFFIHSAFLDVRESDFCEAANKMLYCLSVITLIGHRYENYFVVLNMNMAVFTIFTECLVLLALQTPSKNLLTFRILLGLRIFSWLHWFVNMLPFKYLLPTLFAKDFKLFLNAFLWLWYSMCIWYSPVLQYFYHQIAHNTPLDCVGEGSSAKCILLKDTVDQRHYKALKKAYLEVKLAHQKAHSPSSAQPNENASAKAFQTIKCVMALKRKLKRIREGRDSPSDDDSSSSSPLLSESSM